WYNRLIRRFCRDFNVKSDTPFESLGKAIQRILLYGTTARDEAKYDAYFEGVIPNLQRRWEKTDSDWVKTQLHGYLSESPCETCHGARLRHEALHVFLEAPGHERVNIHDVASMTIEQAIDFFDRLKLQGEQAAIAAPIL